MKRRCIVAAAALVAAWLAAGCGGTSGPDLVENDGDDAATGCGGLGELCCSRAACNAGLTCGNDTVCTVADSGSRVVTDAGVDATTPDSGPVAVTDAGVDATTPDSGPVAVTDASVDATTPDSGGGCEIDGVNYSADAREPNAPCQTCQPAVSATAWSSACGSGTLCSSYYGTCQACASPSNLLGCNEDSDCCAGNGCNTSSHTCSPPCGLAGQTFLNGCCEGLVANDYYGACESCGTPENGIHCDSDGECCAVDWQTGDGDMCNQATHACDACTSGGADCTPSGLPCCTGTVCNGYYGSCQACGTPANDFGCDADSDCCGSFICNLSSHTCT